MSRVPPGLIAVGLVVLAIVPYGKLYRNDFIDLDDGIYITENPRVQGGLTLRNVAWAWSTFYAGYYQPLTWMSLQLDASLFSGDSTAPPKLNAAGFHLDNLFWHAATTALLFFTLCRLTGAIGRSAIVAALFAVHPLHVESVAWVTERKDVLSAFFWVLTLAAYARYVATPLPKWYGAVLLAFALGLLAKPMLVTLPCVLLLLDLWPLQRVSWRAGNNSTAAAAPGATVATMTSSEGLRSPRALLLEKLPLFVLAAVASAVTVMAQRSAKAVLAIDALPFGDRLANSVAAYGWYLEKTFWPTQLAVFYPHQENQWTWMPVLAGAAVLLAVTVFALVAWRRVPALLIGWLWFVGTLVPVIGLVQVGSQSVADRFCYVPHIGLFIGLVWSAAELLVRLRVPAAAQLAFAVSLVLFLASISFKQVDYWHDTETIWTHALDAASDNHRAHANLGNCLVHLGRLSEARAHCEEAVALQPKLAEYQYNLGVILMHQGEYESAIEHFTQALRRQKDYYDAAHNLALARLRLGQPDQAIDEFHRALEIRPEAANSLACLGSALWLQGQRAAAAEAFERALRLQPTDIEALNGLGLVKLRQAREREAAELFQEALRNNPSSIRSYSNLGLALGRLGRWRESASNHGLAVQLESERRKFMTHPGGVELALYRRRLGYALHMLGHADRAIRAYAEAVRLDPGWPMADTATAWQLATAAEASERDVPAALEMAGMACQAVADPPANSLDALAAAYAAASRFDDAKDAARKALTRADPDLARQIQMRLQLYEMGKPYVSASK